MDEDQKYKAMVVVKDAGDTLHKMFEAFENHPDIDQRWLAIARTDLQKGLMSVVRAVTKPEGLF